jgi:AraC-like DNA-binding protein/nuclear transport factor 2 (NTF2) superfamily protein
VGKDLQYRESPEMRVAEFVESYFDAWNHRDARRVAYHLASDGIYCDVPENLQHSRDELLARLTAFFSNNKHHYELIGEFLAGRNSIAFQYRVSPLKGTGSNQAANDFFGAEFVTLQGDSAIRIADYYEIPGTEHPTSPTRIATGVTFREKYAKSGLSDAQMETYMSRLTGLMQVEKIYLRPDLTLPVLAKLVGCSVNHLSQVVNSGFGISFFEYLNQNRIDHAKKLLLEYDGHDQAILSIAFAVGFNSNSSFYAAFKKCSGQTPAQYRRAFLADTQAR